MKESRDRDKIRGSDLSSGIDRDEIEYRDKDSSKDRGGLIDKGRTGKETRGKGYKKEGKTEKGFRGQWL